MAPVERVATPQLKLIYLDHHYWRAECVRLALYLGDVPFEDARMSYEEMYGSGALHFGTFPALVVGGKGVLNQTQAIAAYAGKLTGFYPKDPFLQAKADEAIDGLTDISDLVTDTMQERDPQRKIQWRQHLISSKGRMFMLLSGLEALCVQNGSNGHIAGDGWTVSDFAVWRAVGWLSSGVIDGIPPTYMQNTFPGLWQVHKAVDMLPKVGQWKAAHPHHYRGR
uniref:GST N-terminal domain-containing protein n=1 Tax=Alexandrium monilatum TaxID=311494 RepID=A0A7S4R6U5_9DINO|mmetsp:Transcript_110922/g.353653  ORF Transcript_110922/g.353653 Transcript_110922/m.353653 type:complete len:224 (-) Transcript_110922:247-918(-)